MKPPEKHPSFKAMFEFMTKINDLMKILRVSLKPLFIVHDKAVEAKLQVNDIMKECEGSFVL